VLSVLNRSRHLAFITKTTILLYALNLLYGGLAVLQGLVLHRIFVQSIYIKFLVLAILYLTLIVALGRKSPPQLVIPKRQFFWFSCWFYYSLASFLYLFFLDLPIQYVLFTFVTMLFYPFVALTMYSFTNEVPLLNYSEWSTQKANSFRRLRNALYILAIVIWPLGFVQHFTNNPIIPTQIDSYWTIYSINFFGHVRATSFLQSGAEFGQFSLLVLLISISNLWFYKKRVIDLVFSIVAGVAIYITYTRMVFTDTLFALITLVIMAIIIRMNTFHSVAGRKLTYSRFTEWLPHFYTLITLVSIFGSQYYHMLSDNNSFALNNGISLSARLQEWSYYITEYFAHGNLPTILFGNGLMQNPRFTVSSSILVDNTFLAIYLYQGIVGLFLFIMFYCSSWKWLIRQAISSRNPLEIGFCAMYSTFLATGVVANYNLGGYDFYCILFMVFAFAGYRERFLNSSIHTSTPSLRGGVNPVQDIEEQPSRV
jgi:hypothetical protein